MNDGVTLLTNVVICVIIITQQNETKEKHMGLDNSIEVKRTPYTNTIPELQRFNMSWDTKHEWDFEICYWRKCWNVRGAIFDATDPGKPMDNVVYTLNAGEIDRIIVALQSFNADNWDDGGGSIWDWEDMEERLQMQVENLKGLRKLMDKYDLEVFFVDSY
jgi:hypothetical protein